MQAGGGAHIGALVYADWYGAIVAAEAGVAEAAATEAVADAAAVIERGPAGQEARVATHDVVVRTEERRCTEHLAVTDDALRRSAPCGVSRLLAAQQHGVRPAPPGPSPAPRHPRFHNISRTSRGEPRPSWPEPAAASTSTQCWRECGGGVRGSAKDRDTAQAVR